MFMMSLIHSMLELSKEPFCLCSCVPKKSSCICIHFSCVRVYVHRFIMDACLNMHMHARTPRTHAHVLRAHVGTQKP